MGVDKLFKNVLFVIIGLILVVTIMSETSGDLGTASDNITANSDTWPLANLFKRKGQGNSNHPPITYDTVEDDFDIDPHFDAWNDPSINSIEEV